MTSVPVASGPILPTRCWPQRRNSAQDVQSRSIFSTRLLNGLPPVLYEDGRQTRDFTFVGSVVHVLLDAVLRGVTHDAPVNLAFGSNHSLIEVVRILERLLERDLEVEHGPTRPGDVRHSQADKHRLRQLFPASEPVPLVLGLQQTLAWALEVEQAEVDHWVAIFSYLPAAEHALEEE